MPGYADVAIPSVEHTADPKSLRLAMGKRVRELADGAFELVGGGSVRKVVEPLPGEGEVAEGSWDARRNEVYWRGGATDGGATPGGACFPELCLSRLSALTLLCCSTSPAGYSLGFQSVLLHHCCSR